MFSFVAEESGVSAKFRCGLRQKLHSVIKDMVLSFPFLCAASVCESDNFILMLAPQGHKTVAGSNHGYILYYLGHKKRGVCTF